MPFHSKIQWIVCCILIMGETVFAQTPSASARGEVLSSMQAAYRAFQELQPLISSEQEFVKPDNQEEISALLDTLRTKFGNVLEVKSNFSTEPGFASTLHVLNDMLNDAYNRFNEGKKGYALWRMRTVSNYCVSCHTRFEVSQDFHPVPADISKLNAFEKGEFYLASRQFEKAKSAFLAAARDKKLAIYRIDSLRKWLIIYTRVDPDPSAAIGELQKLGRTLKLNSTEREEIGGWLASLRRWANESKAKIDPLRKAETLIVQGIGTLDPLSGDRSAVELLRASGILHALLEDKEDQYSKKRGHMLYLLGLAYSELPFFFGNELPEMFLEQSIREAPGSSDARKAFRLYQTIVTRGFTGSGGTQLPDDVKLNLSELRQVAYGTPSIHGQL
ncbi:MAG: hypothetical protein KDD42_07650 [Bdellovibrionales bacterium]|nr:hypothetical protein [Bdellovibrionales bacterium]